MAIAINEVRPDRREDALAFAREHNPSPESPDTGRLVLSLSLTAVEDGTLRGAALCTRDEDGGRVVRIVIPEGEDELGQRLVDKALLKLQAAGAHTCRLLTRDGRAWAGTNWLAGIGE